MKKADVQKMQDLYNQWVELLPELEKGLENWKKAEELMKPLAEFYYSDKWRELHDSFNEELDTKGNYSVLSEDALWNAFSEQHQLSLEWLKAITATITSR